MSPNSIQEVIKEGEPVLIVTTKGGKLVHAGHPDTFNIKLIAEYAKEGYQIKTITIEKFRGKIWKWHWEK